MRCNLIIKLKGKALGSGRPFIQNSARKDLISIHDVCGALHVG